MTTSELVSLSLVPGTEHQAQWREKGITLHRQFRHITANRADNTEYCDCWLWLQDPEGHWHEIHSPLLVSQIHNTTDIPHRPPTIEDVGEILQNYAQNNPDHTLNTLLLGHKITLKDRLLQLI